MTLSSLTDKVRAATLVPRWFRQHSRALPLGLLFVLFALTVLSGCIADSAEDSDLPWSSNKGWEGIAPMAPTMMERYE